MGGRTHARCVPSLYYLFHLRSCACSAASGTQSSSRCGSGSGYMHISPSLNSFFSFSGVDTSPLYTGLEYFFLFDLPSLIAILMMAVFLTNMIMRILFAFIAMPPVIVTSRVIRLCLHKATSVSSISPHGDNFFRLCSSKGARVSGQIAAFINRCFRHLNRNSSFIIIFIIFMCLRCGRSWRQKCRDFAATTYYRCGVSRKTTLRGSY